MSNNDIIEEFKKRSLNPDDPIVNGRVLKNWLESSIEIAINCLEDLELREVTRNEFLRGKIVAYEEVLKILI